MMLMMMVMLVVMMVKLMSGMVMMNMKSGRRIKFSFLTSKFFWEEVGLDVFELRSSFSMRLVFVSSALSCIIF